MKKLISAFVAAAVTIGAANAAPVTFYTTKSGHNNDGVGSIGGSSQTYEKHGITMNVTAEIFNDDGTVNNGYSVSPSVGSTGTYILNGPRDNTHQVDGSGLNERLVLDFSMPVKILSATFSYVDKDDGFDFFFDKDGDNDLEWVFQGMDIPGGGSWPYIETFDFTTLKDMYISDLFALGASISKCVKYRSNGKCKKYVSHDWKLKAVTVEKHIPEIPVPAALPLFLAGLGALGWAKRRRQATTA